MPVSERSPFPELFARVRLPSFVSAPFVLRAWLPLYRVHLVRVALELLPFPPIPETTASVFCEVNTVKFLLCNFIIFFVQWIEFETIRAKSSWLFVLGVGRI